MVKRYKYPKTYHLPGSPGLTKDDKVVLDMTLLEQRSAIVITEKMDGENTTIYHDGEMHARSIDGRRHHSRDWVKKFSADLCAKVGPHHKKWRVCGENLYAKHSIHYKNLKSYFYMYNIWEGDFCLDWEYTKKFAEYNGLTLAPVLYEGPYDPLIIKALAASMRDDQEGFVIRISLNIHISDWPIAVGKWVRQNHVQTNKHWKLERITKNEIISEV